MKTCRVLYVLLFGVIDISDAFAQNTEDHVTLFTEHVFSLSEVMLHDVANPPAASRFYAYSILGAYEVAHLSNPEMVNLNRLFNENLNVRSPKRPNDLVVPFASIYAMLEVGRQLMPSGFMLADQQKKLVEIFSQKRFPRKVLNLNVRYALEVASQVVTYAKSDGYNKLSTYKRYSPSRQEGRWYPTPPEYMAAIEPQWKTIRPFFLDSANQFAPEPPAQFSLDTTSSFYKQMEEVAQYPKVLTTEQIEIANFWDCNPFAVDYSGHMAIGLKKISPGGHWVGITGIACIKAKVSLDSAILIHVLTALTLHDAFISCWQEKYSSDRIRPETAINKYFDPSWRPLLQTPPFPEYTSGHSVVSSAAAVMLTNFFGENFSFTDTSENYFGLPERHFKSFFEASEEAAISRLYGGIHFRDACEEGVKQGKKVGALAVRKLRKAIR